MATSDRGIQFFSLVKLRDGGVDLDFRSSVSQGLVKSCLLSGRGGIVSTAG